MQVGIYMFPTDYAIAPAELARAVEARGFDALFFPEHTHIPASRLSAWPGGGELPPEYSHTHDLFVALAMAAAVTKRIRLGTGICLVIERDPIVLAKEVASLDVLSGGRVDFGIGAGWNQEEMANHGTAFQRRFKVMRERVEAMRQIWTQEEASYAGEFVQFERIWSWPKPTQPGGPPVIVGGVGENVLRRVARYGDEWMPNRGQKKIGERIQELRRLAAEAGRKRPRVTMFGAHPEAGNIEQLARQGVDRVLFLLPPLPRDEALVRLDELKAVQDQLAAA